MAYMAPFAFGPLILVAEYNITAMDRFFNSPPFALKSALFAGLFFLPSYLLIFLIKGGSRQKGKRLLIFSASLLAYVPLLGVYMIAVSCWVLNHCL